MSHYGVGMRIQRSEVHAEGFSSYMDLTNNKTGEDAVGFELYSDGESYGQPLDLDRIGGPHFNETRHFVECIDGNREPWSGLRDALATMRLCEAINTGCKGPLTILS